MFACVYLKRETLNTVGLLDEDYFSYFEDTDYCFRVKERGLRVVCCGSVRVIHHEHVSTRVNGVPQSKVFESAKAVFRRKWESKLRAKRYTREIGWHSLMNFPTGYAISSRELATALDRHGVHVAYQVRVRSGYAFSAGRAGDERDEDGGDDSRAGHWMRGEYRWSTGKAISSIEISARIKSASRCWKRMAFRPNGCGRRT